MLESRTVDAADEAGGSESPSVGDGSNGDGSTSERVQTQTVKDAVDRQRNGDAPVLARRDASARRPATAACALRFMSRSVWSSYEARRPSLSWGERVLLEPAESCMGEGECESSPIGGAGGSRVCLSCADEAVEGRLVGLDGLGGVARRGMVGTMMSGRVEAVRE